MTLHFIVNDIFMVFFFGIAAKEVTEACLPGGSLNPIRKAVSPLIGTVGGVLGPIVVYLLVCLIQFHSGAFEGYESKIAVAAREYALTVAAGGLDSGNIVHVDAAHGSGSGSHRMLAGGSASGSGGGGGGTAIGGLTGEELLAFDFSSPEASLSFAELAHGWGVPTATDISLAWMVAMQVFPHRHPAIEFLLLLAVADDAIGLAIIAINYGDPTTPCSSSTCSTHSAAWRWRLCCAGCPFASATGGHSISSALGC